MPEKDKNSIINPRDDDRSWRKSVFNRRLLRSFDTNDEYIDRVYDDDDNQEPTVEIQSSANVQRRGSVISTAPTKSKTRSKGKKAREREDDAVSKRGSAGSAVSSTKKKNVKNVLVKKVSLEENNLPPEFAEFQGVFTDFNLEAWWRRSPLFIRLNAILVALLLTFAIAHFIAGVMLIYKSFRQTIRSPYVCQTPECQKASTWLTEPMDTTVDPCENFYEYMCRNYKEGNSGEGTILSELIYVPAFKVEFGANSILAKVLKNFRNDPAYDQTIRFYQACLHEPKRKEFGLEAFKETLEKIFGTRDFSTFESTSLSMEEIGANMLRYSGEAAYINMAFYTYPYILILRPSRKIHEIFKSSSKADDEALVKRLFEKLLPDLGESDAKQIQDSYHGVEVITKIESIVHDELSDEQFPKDLKQVPQSFIDKVKAELAGSCPPMGIQLDIRKMLELFIKDDFRMEFYDLMALKFFVAYQTCFNEDPSKFTFVQIDHPKTAFVAPWIFGLFWEFLSSMDTIDLMDEWEIGVKNFSNSKIVGEIYDAATHNIELRCMLDLTINYGYMPAIRYLTSTVEHPAEYLQMKKDEIYKLIEETKEYFFRIASSEIDANEMKMGEFIFSREFLVDVMMPLVSGLLDEFAIFDELVFGEDHLRNSLMAIEYTVERARLNWMGSTNTEPVLRWWGFGGPGDIQYELFDIRQGFIKAPELIETFRPVNFKQWYKFLGRPHPNYVLFLLSLYEGPYHDETLFLELGSVTVKIIRAIYSLLIEPFYDSRYPSFEDWKDWIYYGEPRDNLPRKCSFLRDGVYKPKMDFIFEFNHNITTGVYTWSLDHSFQTVLSLKQTLQILHKRRNELSSERLDWSVPIERRRHRMDRLLPGKLLSNFTEEQLFLMTYVRNLCRGSWKDHDDDLKKKRFYLESTAFSVLMQLEEFQVVWNCKKDAFMSNAGNDRCFRWMP